MIRPQNAGTGVQRPERPTRRLSDDLQRRRSGTGTKRHCTSRRCDLGGSIDVVSIPDGRRRHRRTETIPSRGLLVSVASAENDDRPVSRSVGRRASRARGRGDNERRRLASGKARPVLEWRKLGRQTAHHGERKRDEPVETGWPSAGRPLVMASGLIWIAGDENRPCLLRNASHIYPS